MRYRHVVGACAHLVFLASFASVTAGARAAEQKAAEQPGEHAVNQAKADEADADAPASVDAARARALQDGWPDTPAGWVASRWVEAYSTGEDAMVKFLQDNLTEAGLAEPPMQERLSRYRALRERLGDLMLASVSESARYKLSVVLFAEDASPHRFVFTVEEKEPHRLVQVGILQHGHGHRGHPNSR